MYIVDAWVRACSPTDVCAEVLLAVVSVVVVAAEANIESRRLMPVDGGGEPAEEKDIEEDAEDG